MCPSLTSVFVVYPLHACIAFPTCIRVSNINKQYPSSCMHPSMHHSLVVRWTLIEIPLPWSWNEMYTATVTNKKERKCTVWKYVIRRTSVMIIKCACLTNIKLYVARSTNAEHKSNKMRVIGNILHRHITVPYYCIACNHPILSRAYMHACIHIHAWMYMHVHVRKIFLLFFCLIVKQVRGCCLVTPFQCISYLPCMRIACACVYVYVHTYVHTYKQHQYSGNIARLKSHVSCFSSPTFYFCGTHIYVQKKIRKFSLPCCHFKDFVVSLLEHSKVSWGKKMRL